MTIVHPAREVYRSAPAGAAAARAFVVDQAHAADLPGGLVEDLALAASELATNAIRHGTHATNGGAFTVSSEVIDGHAAVRVDNPGPSPISIPNGPRMPGVDAEGGRGLAILRDLGAHVDIAPGGVTASFDLARYSACER
ncbi:ATP-binding protein [Spirillospora sp. NPDC048911]|uniref:ATP-binding protein n=1 Tax=Spirillospora sp. NPDC048911 TaxID=3364527 RepID=UPI00371D1EEF